ncbi:unnamed protein product [Arabidopsis arenosa]|uniref:non-specific serine/threonine protein kinase n=1 Tax=Arabidopsis arenosa TaxID=38785 RepID=A0A8S2B8A9_ARAAE|nr:unnamed protein product [Arabidopsis arenosa]
MPSTAIILLVRYGWNMSALVEDYNSLMRLEPLLVQCAHVAFNSLNQKREYCVCNVSLICWEFNCGHSICNDCIPGAVSNQLNTSTLIICPDPNCNYFINYSNVLADIRTLYLTSLLLDYVDTLDKRSCFAKCVDMAWSHRKKVISAVDSALKALKDEWTSPPDGWEGSDPCGTNWVGITCQNNRVVSISLGNLNLEGKLQPDISFLSELRILDLSYNPKLSGPLPPNIGNLGKLRNLILVGCSFSGQIPESIGMLKELIYLSLNLNQFSGTIPASIGQLSKLYWFDIADNQIEGELPVSNGTSSPGLDMLLQTKHFHFGKNKLSGKIPKELFSSNMTLIHVLFDGNQFTGEIPETLSLVKTLTVLRLDRNKLIGDIPSNLNNLTNLNELYLANNRFTGTLPNLTSLTSLYTFDVSNNTLDFSPIPSWISSLPSLSTLRMEGIQLNGSIPISFFSPPQLQTVILKRNSIVETLDFANKVLQVILANNPVCLEAGNGPILWCRRQKKRAERATGQNNPFAKWDTSKSSIDAPQLMGAKAFTFDELKKCTDNFSEANDVGGGGYGKVYRGILPNGQLIAIKRAQQGSLQGGSPIERGKYVVREVKTKMNTSRNLYDLQELLDTTIIASSGNLKGFEKYVDLALRCVEEEGVNRPSMGEVVKEIENIMQLAGLNPNSDSATSSRTYEDAIKGSGDPYGSESFQYSGNFPASKLEPQ